MKPFLIETFNSNRELMERAEFLHETGLHIPEDDPIRLRFPAHERSPYILASISHTNKGGITGLFRAWTVAP